jgi:hypothetical protein
MEKMKTGRQFTGPKVYSIGLALAALALSTQPAFPSTVIDCIVKAKVHVVGSTKPLDESFDAKRDLGPTLEISVEDAYNIWSVSLSDECRNRMSPAPRVIKLRDPVETTHLNSGSEIFLLYEFGISRLETHGQTMYRLLPSGKVPARSAAELARDEKLRRAPEIHSIGPLSAPFGKTITIKGANLFKVTSYEIGGIRLVDSGFGQFKSATGEHGHVEAREDGRELSIYVPEIIQSADRPITVYTTGGTATSKQLFHYMPVLPEKFKVEPMRGEPGDQVLVSGEFQGLPEVFFAGADRRAETVSVEPGKVVVQVPAGAKTGTVVLRLGTKYSVSSTGDFVVGQKN